MIRINDKPKLTGKLINDCDEERKIPNRNFNHKLVPNIHHTLSPGYVWMIVTGPDYLIGRFMPINIIKIGGWTNGTIKAINIRSGDTIEIDDSVEAVI